MSRKDGCSWTLLQCLKASQDYEAFIACIFPCVRSFSSSAEGTFACRSPWVPARTLCYRSLKLLFSLSLPSFQFLPLHSSTFLAQSLLTFKGTSFQIQSRIETPFFDKSLRVSSFAKPSQRLSRPLMILHSSSFKMEGSQICFPSEEVPKHSFYPSLSLYD